MCVYVRAAEGSARLVREKFHHRARIADGARGRRRNVDLAASLAGSMAGFLEATRQQPSELGWRRRPASSMNTSSSSSFRARSKVHDCHVADNSARLGCGSLLLASRPSLSACFSRAECLFCLGPNFSHEIVTNMIIIIHGAAADAVALPT